MKHKKEEDTKHDRSETRYAAILKPVVKHFENGTVCLIFDKLPTWVCTSTVGLEIFRLFEKEPISVSEVLSTVAKEYSIPVKIIEADICQFIDRLISINAIIVSSGNLSNQYPVCENNILPDKTREPANTDIKILCKKSDMDRNFKSLLFENDLLENLLKEISLSGENTFVNFVGYNTASCDAVFSSIEKVGKSEFIKYAISSFAHEVTLDEITKIEPYVESIEIVFASLNSSLYDDIHGEGAFAKAIDFVENVMEMNRAFIGVTLCASTATETDWMNFPGFASKYAFHSARVGGSELYHSMYSGESRFKFNCISQFRQILNYQEKQAIQRATQLLQTPRKDLIDFKTSVYYVPGNNLLSTSIKKNCPGGLSSLTFLPDGSCFPCSSLSKNETCLIGYFPSRSYQQLRNEGIKWNGNVFNVDNDPTCSICCYRYFCGGGCRAAAASIGTFDSRCELFLQEYDRLLSAAAFYDRKQSSQYSEKTLEDYGFGAFSNCRYS